MTFYQYFIKIEASCCRPPPPSDNAVSRPSNSNEHVNISQTYPTPKPNTIEPKLIVTRNVTLVDINKKVNIYYDCYSLP